jgi:hypothetical protein
MADTDKPAPSPDGVGGGPLKKKRHMTPEHLAKLAEARKKANEIRLAKQAEKREQKELEKKVKNLEEKKRLKDLKDREAQLSTQEEAVELKEPKGEVVEVGVTKEQQQQLLEEEQTAKEVKRTVRKATRGTSGKPRKKKVIYISDSSSSDEEEEKVVYVRRKGKKPPTVQTPQEPAEKSMANEILRRSYQQEVDRARIDQMKQFFKPTCNWTR